MTSPNTIIADLTAEVESLRKQLDELLSAAEEADDCKEILENIIGEISRYGNYSKESTIVFLEQARSSLNPFLWAVSRAKGNS